MSRVLRRLIAAFLWIAPLILTVPAHAEWREARTDRFVLYSEGSEADLRARVVALHRFDRLIRAPFGLSDAAPARPLPIILVSGRAGMEAVYPDVPEHLGGWYSSTENDVYAVLDRRQDDKVLLHEYVHHVMRQNFPIALPAWFTEGVAEFYMTADITDRQTQVGYSDSGRVFALNQLAWLPMDRLLTRRALSGNREAMSAFYAQSWLLTHYLLSDPGRRQGLEVYLKAVSDGVAPLEAVRSALGTTPEALERALRTYQRGTMPYAAYPTPHSDAVAMTIRTLPPSADVLFPLSIRLNYAQRGTDGPQVLARVQEAAARWPDDRLARMTLAKAEFAWGTPETTEAALNGVLALDAADAEALRWMARLRQRAAAQAQEAGDDATRDLRNGEARVFLARALAADPNDYRIYQALGRSRRWSASYPNDNDLATWSAAVELAPQVGAVRWEAAEAFSRAGQTDTAIALLLPLANDPHGGTGAAQARARLQALRPDDEASPEAETPVVTDGPDGPAVAPEPDAG